MSYDNRSHRGYHPYQRDQRYQQQPDYRSNNRYGNDMRNDYNDHRAPGRGPHGDSYSAGRPYVHASGGAGSFQSPQDHRSFHNGSHASYGHHQQDWRMLPPPDQRQSFHQHHSSHSFADHSSDRPFTRHSTGSSVTSEHPGSRFRDAVCNSNNRRESDPAPYSSTDRRSNPTASNDLQSRTLVVRQFHENVTKELLKELFHQVGPVRNVVLRPDHAFIEFQDSDSVAYALAAMDNVHVFGVRLRLEPKLDDSDAYRFINTLKQYERNPELFGVILDTDVKGTT